MKNNNLKIPVSIFLVALTTFAIGIYGVLPWWSFVISNVAIAIAIPQKPLIAFLTGALGVAFVWAGLAIGLDAANNHILSTKVASILPLGGSSIKLILVTTLVGFFLGGMASLTGSFARKS